MFSHACCGGFFLHSASCHRFWPGGMSKHVNIIEIDYTNWEGRREMRAIIPRSFRFDKSTYHPLKWTCDAYCVEKKVYRDFALEGIHSWKEIIC
jgi:hypothetical protein